MVQYVLVTTCSPCCIVFTAQNPRASTVNKAIRHRGLSQNSHLEMCSMFEFKYYFPCFDNSCNFVSLPIKMAYYKHFQPSSTKENQELAIERFHFDVEDDNFQEPSMEGAPILDVFYFHEHQVR